MEPVNRVQEKQRTNPFVQVVATPPKPIQPRALFQQLVGRQTLARGIKRLIANGRVGGCDNLKKIGHGCATLAASRSERLMVRRRERLPLSQQAHEFRQNQIAIVTTQRNGKLRDKQSVLVTDVVTRTINFERKVSFSLTKFV